ncbi:MAG TPA: cytochrome c [Acidimicrobiales bacterium]|nr:cytochrome c [Acidimicrobiales bacterium]
MTIVAAFSSQQKVGVVIGAVLILGWLGYLITHLMKAGAPPGSEIELAPNRKPYFDDDQLETKKLDAALGVALLLTAVSAVGLPAYWVMESGRQVNAIKGFDNRAVKRGHSLFLPTDSPEHGAHFGCATCHGAVGGGGVTKYTITDFLGRTEQVTWAAPAINTVAYRYSTEQIRQILVYGRAGSPMPAWGTKGGGPMNDQQIDDLVQFMQTPSTDDGLKIEPEAAKAQALANAEGEARMAGKLNLAGEPLVDGESLFNGNCARCHTRGFSFNRPEVSGGGRYGPNLRDGSTVRQFPKVEDMIEFIKEGAQYGEPYGEGGIGHDAGGGMPYFGEVLSDEDIAAIVAYERSL